MNFASCTYNSRIEFLQGKEARQKYLPIQDRNRETILPRINIFACLLEAAAFDRGNTFFWLGWRHYCWENSKEFHCGTGMVYFQMIGSRKKDVKCELCQLYVQSKNNIFTRREEARREYLPIQTEIEKPFCFITL